MDKEIIIKYNDDLTIDMPHIVAFSGGRSSGMMLLNLLENDLLVQKRGDVVVFNNTSAEHIETYNFVEKFANITESHGIPFFIIEFDTYEQELKGTKIRRLTYKLKKHRRDVENGYNTDGSVFEHAISWNRFLPNRYTRSCTAHLKGEINKLFKEDWLSSNKYIDHIGPESSTPSITRDDAIFSYNKFCRGATTFEDYMKLSEYAYSFTANREMQFYHDYSSIGKVRTQFENKKHIDLLGIRAEEWRRISKMKENRGNVLLPLVDSGIVKNDVVQYWSERNFDLNLPDSGMLSNCVFCPIKSWETLKTIEMNKKTLNNSEDLNAPAKIEWWIDIENKYQKPTSKGALTGFFGVQREGRKKENFERLKEEAKSSEQSGFHVTDYISCECGD